MQDFNYRSLFLAASETDLTWLIWVSALLVLLFFVATGCAIYFIIKYERYKKDLGSIQDEKSRMIAEATEESKQIKKEALLEVKEQEIKLRGRPPAR